MRLQTGAVRTQRESALEVDPGTKISLPQLGVEPASVACQPDVLKAWLPSSLILPIGSAGDSLVSLAEGDGNSPVSLEGDRNSPVSLEGDMNSPVFPEGDMDSPVFLEGNMNSPISSEGDMDSPVFLEGDMNSPISPEGDMNSPVFIEGELTHFL